MARAKINFKKIGFIQQPIVRKAITGGILIEIDNDQNREKAKVLAGKIREIVPHGAKISIPVMRAEVKISDLDDTITREDIIEAIQNKTECLSEEITISNLVNMNGRQKGLKMAWIKCPFTTALGLTDTETLDIGWTRARVKIVERPLQCYKCWDYGHVRARCTSNKERTGICFKCGIADGHKTTAPDFTRA